MKRLTYNYRNRPWRTWYIIAVGTAAALYFDSFWAMVFVALATVDVEEA